MKRIPTVQVKNVLVTGCSSGIGAATAITLRNEGWNVVPTARKDEDLEALRKQGFTPIRLDVADADSVRAVANETLRFFDGQAGGLVNNAGFGQPGALEDLSRDAMRYQFEVNVFGMQQLTNYFIPVFRQQGWGRIVNISSVVGRISLPFLGIYSATKFAMEAMSDAMRVELSHSGIGISLVEPGPIASQFKVTALERAKEELTKQAGHHSDLYAEQMLRDTTDEIDNPRFKLPPEAVARKILHALESTHPRSRYKVTVPAYLGAIMSRIAPDTLIDTILYRRGQKQVATLSTTKNQPHADLQ